MSRNVSTGFMVSLHARESGVVAAVLLTITHADMAEPIRLSTDPTERLSTDPVVYGSISRGQHYAFVPIAVVLPDDGDDAAPAASLEIDNTDRELIAAVRSITDAAEVTLEIIDADDPDVVEIAFPAMRIANVTYDRSIVRFGLAVDGLQAEPYPGASFLPSGFPGLF